MVRQFANVSIIDLGLVLKTLDDILGKIGFVIRFMAAFSIITGLSFLLLQFLSASSNGYRKVYDCAHWCSRNKF
jgi:predicted lysophospholipase L1 biosynthesis ABC-type transport system permease subunit